MRLTPSRAFRAPLLHFAVKENRGGAESVKFIEVRMNVSGAKQVWLRSQGDSLADESEVVKWATQSEPWKSSSDVVEGKINTYRFEVASSRSASTSNFSPSRSITLRLR